MDSPFSRDFFFKAGFAFSRGHPLSIGFVTANPPEGVGWGVAEGVVEGVVWGVGGSVGLRVLRRVSLVVSDRGCGRKVLREVSPVVSPVSPIGLEFLGVLLVLDCGRGWEVLCGVLLVVFDRGFGWEVLCWDVAWRVSCGV